MLGGMDVFVLTYAELKEAALITNDWALWYVAWKRGIRSYLLATRAKKRACAQDNQ